MTQLWVPCCEHPINDQSGRAVGMLIYSFVGWHWPIYACLSFRVTRVTGWANCTVSQFGGPHATKIAAQLRVETRHPVPLAIKLGIAGATRAEQQCIVRRQILEDFDEILIASPPVMLVLGILLLSGNSMVGECHLSECARGAKLSPFRFTFHPICRLGRT